MNKLRQWWHGRWRVQLKIVEVRREPCRLKLEEWRADPAWAGMAAAVLADPRLKQMLDVVEGSSPAFDVLPLHAPLTERSILQARAEGYTMALANLRALGSEVALPQAVEALFAEVGK